jgi:hypothetical protein
VSLRHRIDGPIHTYAVVDRNERWCLGLTLLLNCIPVGVTVAVKGTYTSLLICPPHVVRTKP